MMATLGRTIPALPVRDTAAAAVFYRDRLGFRILHHDEGFVVLERDGAQVRARDVLHPVSRDGVTKTDFGSREFATLDADGNLVSFFEWVAR
ncbi:MAG TPA: hypothetical protein VLD16_12955 [Gaiellaceae bacterium]|nr:hypothetical protein [Gaiellaceae bacterium]